jgi:hypothetical protein
MTQCHDLVVPLDQVDAGGFAVTRTVLFMSCRLTTGGYAPRRSFRPSFGNESTTAVNARQDDSWATQTSKHEIESYLHPDAIKDTLGVVVDVADHLNANGHAVPKAVAMDLHSANSVGDPKKDSTNKKLLASKAFLARLPTCSLSEIRMVRSEAGWFAFRPCRSCLDFSWASLFATVLSRGWSSGLP